MCAQIFINTSTYFHNLCIHIYGKKKPNASECTEIGGGGGEERCSMWNRIPPGS
jgi:hypothetical protein